MSEEKIGMYSTEEIYEELATGFLHHSMVDAMYFKIKDLQQKVEQQEDEIDRLNNIINKLEKWCNECIDNQIIARENGDTTISDTFFEIVLDKLKALKENNNE